RHTRCYRDWSSDVCSSDLSLCFSGRHAWRGWRPGTGRRSWHRLLGDFCALRGHGGGRPTAADAGGLVTRPNLCLSRSLFLPQNADLAVSFQLQCFPNFSPRQSISKFVFLELPTSLLELRPFFRSNLMIGLISSRPLKQFGFADCSRLGVGLRA